MSNLTYIEDLRKEIETLCGNCDRPDKEELGRMILSSMAMGFNAGVKAPSADRPQGHYIKSKNGEWYCSNCKRIDDKYSVARFCWWCGARMKGADDEMQ